MSRAERIEKFLFLTHGIWTLIVYLRAAPSTNSRSPSQGASVLHLAVFFHRFFTHRTSGIAEGLPASPQFPVFLATAEVRGFTVPLGTISELVLHHPNPTAWGSSVECIVRQKRGSHSKPLSLQNTQSVSFGISRLSRGLGEFCTASRSCVTNGFRPKSRAYNT